MLVTNARANDCSDILAVTAMYIKNGYITTPKWAQPFDSTKAFSQYDAKGNELARFVLCDYDLTDKYDNQGYDRFNEFILNGGHIGYIERRDLKNNGEITALYKLAGDTIYQYDNNPDLKKGFLGFLGFCEDGPGHLISTTKILDDGSLIKYNPTGNKIASLKFTDYKTIKEINVKGNVTGCYKLFTYEEVFPEENESDSSISISQNSSNSSGAIVPIIIALAKADELNDTTFSARVKNATSVSHYDSYGNSDGRFTISGNNISHYNVYNKLIAKYHIFGTSISHYDNSGNLIGTFTVFGTSISHYNSSGYVIDNYSISGNTISKRNAQGYSTESFSIFGDSVSHYNSSGYSVGSFSFF